MNNKFSENISYLRKTIFNDFGKLPFLKLSRFLFYSFVFLLPFQVSVLVYSSPLYFSGNFNPYTSFFVYLADIVFFAALICWAISFVTNEYKEKISYGNYVIFILLFVFLILGEFSVFLAEDKWLAFNIVFRLLEFALVYLFAVNKVVKLETVIKVFIASVSFQAFVGIFQYIKQGSIGLHFLGETYISPDSYGIAKINLEDSTLIRPYGTFPHPNMLAGYLLAGMLLTFHRIRNKEYLCYPLLFLQAGAFVLAFSRGAFLALLVAFFVYISVKETRISLKYILLFFSMLVFFAVLFNFEETLISRILFTDIASFDERVFYFNISKWMFYQNPLGSGLGNFTLMMPDFINTKLDPWMYQPVHNIYMLLLNEVGIQGVITFLMIFLIFPIFVFKTMKKSIGERKDLGAILLAIISAIFVIGLFDHYLISLHQGLALIFLMFSLSGRYINFSKNR